MVDLSNLQLVPEEIEVADDATYQDAQEFPPPLPEGIYTFVQGKPEFAPTKGGQLGATMHHVVAGGPEDGKKLMFDRISDKVFDRQNVKVSGFMDHIRAVYSTGERQAIGRSRQEQADAIERAEGKTFQAAVQWDGYCDHKDTPHEGKDPVTVRRATNFPQGKAKCTVCGKDIEPRARINRRIAAS